MENRYEMFTVLVNKINRSIKKIKNEQMKEYNLKSIHVSCLYYLYNRGTLTSAELTELCDEDKAAISRSINYLEKNGYINCDSICKKRYKSPLTLTDSGMKIGQIICNKIDKILEQSSHGLNEAELALFYEGLNLINNNLKNISETGE